MIHGHTRITLRNPFSGHITKDVEFENTFQPAVLQNFTFGLGEDLHGFPSYDWTDLVGGILLFEDAIEGGNNVYMPSSNRMIGNGAYGISNSSEPNELGSYSSESSAGPTAITQVYDFATNQANGTINCVCLTSKMGGEIGYGNASGRRTNIPFIQGQTGGINGGINIAIVNNIEYTFTLSGNTLTIKKTKKSITQGSVFRGFYTTTTKDLSNIKPSGTTLNSGISVFALNNGKIRIYAPIESTIASGHEVYYFDYNPSNDNVELGHFTNNAGKSIRGDVVAMSFTPDEYCATYDSNGYLQIFNTSTGVHALDYTAESLMGDRNGNYDMPLSDGLLLALNSGNGFIVNYVRGSVKPINITGVGNYSIFNKRYPSLDALSFTDGDQPILIKNPLYLATINNIEEVTKTSASTMKVTYTLTES